MLEILVKKIKTCRFVQAAAAWAPPGLPLQAKRDGTWSQVSRIKARKF